MIRIVWIAALSCVLALVLYIPSAVPPDRLMQTVRSEHELNTTLWGMAAADRILECKEETLRGVAQARSRAGARGGFRVDHRQDGADDDVPIFTDGNGNDRLDVGHIFHRVGGTDAEVPVVLGGYGDEVGNGVVEFLGQLGLLVSRGLTLAAAVGGGGVCGGRG